MPKASFLSPSRVSFITIFMCSLKTISFGMNSIAIVMIFRISLRHPATFIIELLFALFLMTPFVCCFRWVGVCLVLVLAKHSRCCAVTLSWHSWVSNAAIIAIGTLLNWIFHLSTSDAFDDGCWKARHHFSCRTAGIASLNVSASLLCVGWCVEAVDTQGFLPKVIF